MLSRVAAEMAAEIKQQDWSDAPFRIDRAGHQRRNDSNRGTGVLNEKETENVKTNVMWVTAQVLGHNDPSFNVLEYAAACGIVGLSSTGWIKAGVRVTDGRYDPPGTLASASDLLPRCHVCAVIIEPDKDGEIRREMVEQDGRIVWGPVWVHAECRTGVSTPYDQKLGNGFTAAWDHVKI